MNTPWTFEGLEINLLTSRRLRGRIDGEAYFDLLLSKYPEILPQKFNSHEPLTEPFYIESLEKSIDIWKTGECYLWKRRKPRAEGSVWFMNPSVHDAITFWIVFKDIGEDKCRSLFVDLVQLFPPDYAYLHLLCKPEYDRLLSDQMQRTMREPFSSNINTHHLRNNLPDLQWANVLGPPYVNLFGMDRLLSAPAAVVHKIGSDRVYIQLTESMVDLRDDYEEVESIKDRIKLHLNHNAFFDPSAGYEHRYNVPVFRFGEENGTGPILDPRGRCL